MLGLPRLSWAAVLLQGFGAATVVHALLHSLLPALLHSLWFTATLTARVILTCLPTAYCRERDMCAS